MYKMRLIIATVLLFVIPAWGQDADVPSAWTAPLGWVYVTETDDGSVYFIHTTSIMRNPAGVDLWVLTNYDTPQDGSRANKSYKSEKTFRGFDCKKKTSVIRSGSQYSELSGGGKIVFSQQDEKPTILHTSPDSIGEALLIAACEKPSTRKQRTKQPSVDEQVEQAKNNNPYLVHWESNDPAAWDEALRQDEVLRADARWADKPYAQRFAEVVRRVRAILPEASTPQRRK